MIEDFFNDICEIYHVRESSTPVGYGIQNTVKFEYSDTPDITNQACHFHINESTIVVVQNEPTNDLDAKTKLSFPFGTDIRLNDKIVDKKTGLSYTSDFPRSPRNHHTFVYIKREGRGRTL